MIALAGYLYAALAAAAVLFQVALAFGAPWGAAAMGGRWQGRFPVPVRAFALAQAGVIAGMALVVAARAGITELSAGPRWLYWIVLLLTALRAVANLTTPSAPERKLWAPVTLVMLIAAGIVAFG